MQRAFHLQTVTWLKVDFRERKCQEYVAPPLIGHADADIVVVHWQYPRKNKGIDQWDPSPEYSL
jgi:hypothetical protein